MSAPKQKQHIDSTTIRRIIRNVRLQNNLTLPEMAERIGDTADNLARIEAGRKNVSAGWWLFFCKLYEINPDICKYNNNNPD